jgi:hypothetical protein
LRTADHENQKKDATNGEGLKRQRGATEQYGEEAEDLE